MKFYMQDVKLSFYNPDERANGWKFNPDVGVKALHVPTGLEACSGIFRNRGENQSAAVATLRTKVESHFSDEINLQYIKDAMDKGVIISRETWMKVLNIALKATTAPVEAAPLSIKVWQERARNDALEEAAQTIEGLNIEAIDAAAEEIRSLKTKKEG